jgi:hypothetical protein
MCEEGTPGNLGDPVVFPPGMPEADRLTKTGLVVMAPDAARAKEEREQRGVPPSEGNEARRDGQQEVLAAQ